MTSTVAGAPPLVVERCSQGTDALAVHASTPVPLFWMESDWPPGFVPLTTALAAWAHRSRLVDQARTHEEAAP